MIYLGVDLGERRIGLALCDDECPVATAYKTVTVTSTTEAVEAVISAAAETKSERIVIGLPLDMSGRMGKKAKEAKQFSQTLEENGLISILWDERLSTTEAENSLKAAGLNRKERKKNIDALAAQRILSSYISSKSINF